MKKPVLFVLIGIAIGACGASLRPAIPASAATGKVCDYTKIVESGSVGVGEEGAIEYSEEWNKVLNAGWRLHSIGGSVFMFERCR